MAIICIKIGENEPESYLKFSQLYHHLDIVEVLPRKRDKQGNLLHRTMGTIGDKHYLGINVDLDELSDEEFEIARDILKGTYLDDNPILTQAETEDMNTAPDKEALKAKAEAVGGNLKSFLYPQSLMRRMRFLDLTSTNGRDAIGISTTTLNKINQKAEDRRHKREIDMTEINRLDIVIPFGNIAKTITNKFTGDALENELSIKNKSMKQFVSQKKAQGKGEVELCLYQLSINQVRTTTP